MNQALYDLFKQLSQEEYEAHPTYTIPANDVLIDNKPSDCQDRSYALADKAEKLGLNPEFLWLVWWKEKITSHVVVLIDGRVWDATWKLNGKADYWDYPLEAYLEDAKQDFKIKTPYWIRKIVR